MNANTAPARQQDFAAAGPIPRESIDFLVATAARAPSVHNIQPWTFAYTADGTLELRIDPDRNLPIADPNARELVVSCGAALLNLRLAVRQLQLQPVVETTAWADDPLLLARVRAVPAPGPSADEHVLIEAIPRRHTHRGTFTDECLPADRRDALAAAAAVEGAWLRYLDKSTQLVGLTALARAADAAQHADTDWRAEMALWTPAPGERRRDGVPVEAYAPRPAAPSGPLPARDFALGRSWGWVGDEHTRPAAVAVLLTDDDQIADWLRAGQALQRCLLRGAADWIFATFATQPLEVPFTRAALRDLLQTRGFPQMVLGLGHAHSASVTPRRPTEEMLHRTP